jgi:hypothetical protein
MPTGRARRSCRRASEGASQPLLSQWVECSTGQRMAPVSRAGERRAAIIPARHSRKVAQVSHSPSRGRLGDASSAVAAGGTAASISASRQACAHSHTSASPGGFGRGPRAWPRRPASLRSGWPGQSRAGAPTTGLRPVGRLRKIEQIGSAARDPAREAVRGEDQTGGEPLCRGERARSGRSSGRSGSPRPAPAEAAESGRPPMAPGFRPPQTRR